MREVVEAEEGLAARAAELIESARLGAGHVGHEAAEENDPGAFARMAMVGDCRAVLA